MGDFTSEDRDKLIETHTLVKTMVSRIEDHENRLRHGEGIMLKAVGGGGVLGALLTALWQKLPF